MPPSVVPASGWMNDASATCESAIIDKTTAPAISLLYMTSSSLVVFPEHDSFGYQWPTDRLHPLNPNM